MNAPVLLFVYKRLEHTIRTLESLKRNAQAHQSDLIVYSDGAKTLQDESGVAQVRHYLQTLTGFKSVSVVNRPHNYGLAKSIISGVTQALQEHASVIVLEDDMVTSPYFLQYMNEALTMYADDDRVVSIHGYSYPSKHPLPETFFLKGADCWGWATWRRGWAVFNPDGQYLRDQLRLQRREAEFDFRGAHPYVKMLEKQIAGKNDSWAIRWYASAFLQDKLTLYCGRSLVCNIGNDDSGTHATADDSMHVELALAPIHLEAIAVEHSVHAYEIFSGYFRNRKLGRIMKKIVQFLAMK